jgi:hypothetical protein
MLGLLEWQAPRIARAGADSRAQRRQAPTGDRRPRVGHDDPGRLRAPGDRTLAALAMGEGLTEEAREFWPGVLRDAIERSKLAEEDTDDTDEGVSRYPCGIPANVKRAVPTRFVRVQARSRHPHCVIRPRPPVPTGTYSAGCNQRSARGRRRHSRRTPIVRGWMVPTLRSCCSRSRRLGAL